MNTNIKEGMHREKRKSRAEMIVKTGTGDE